MNGNFRLDSIRLAILLAFPVLSLPVVAAEPFSALPPALSSSVAPNIMLYLDTSGSMLQDQNNAWIDLQYTHDVTKCDWRGRNCVTTSVTESRCDMNANWSLCVNNDTNSYRTVIDDPVLSPNTKMNIAKVVLKDLLSRDSSRKLRFGLFTFHDNKNDVGKGEREEAGVVRFPVMSIAGKTEYDGLVAAIDDVYGRTGTPLGEGLLEVTRYFEGKKTLYPTYAVTNKKDVNGNLFIDSNGEYTSPIQYRCQKNFSIIITDGDAQGDNNLPGPALTKIDYIARDSAGAAVSKSFGICLKSDTTAPDGYSVTCPTLYEESTVNRVFINKDLSGNTNYPDALRDVAMYANVADLRVGGTDLDGKSFDDAKFAKQNMRTYTVGFSLPKDNQVLPATASVGGGKYYKAGNPTELANALANAVDSISSVVSTAGGLETTSEVKASGNKLFQPVFYSDGWYGQLRCYNMTAAGGLGSACSNSKATIPGEGAKTGTGAADASQSTKNTATATRKIFSAKWQSGTISSFDFNPSGDTTGATTLGSMTATQKGLLGADATEQQNTIRFLRGIEGITGFRSRLFVDPASKTTNTVLLGDILDGQPLVVAAPSGITTDTDYATFKTTNASRSMVFIGANDGMLHAFGVSDMKELMGYIPSAVYPHLKALTATDYGASAGTPHTYHVNGQLRKQDIKVDKVWQTLLVGGLAQGGQGYFAIDATSATDTVSKSASAAVKWEFNDQHDKEMGYTFGTPLIYNVRTASDKVIPAVIVANGYENSYDDTAVGGQKATANSSALYILKASDGTLLKKITVAGTGLSSPAGVDYGQDGVLDYVYAGDMNGNLWRFDLTGDTPSDFKAVSSPIFSAGVDHPITIRPAVKAAIDKDGKSIGNLVLFGTGKLLTEADRKDETLQTFYAVLDDMSDTGTTVAKSKLFKRTVLDTKAVVASGTGTNAIRGGSYRKLSNDAFDLRKDSATYSGWYVDLPTPTERATTSPLLVNNLVVFGTGIPKAPEVCVAGGSGWIMGVDPMTGTIPKANDKEYSFLDIKLDGESTVDDKVDFSTGKGYASGFSKDGIPTELAYVANSTSTLKASTSGTGLGDAGNVLALTDSNSSGVYVGNPGSKVPSTGNPVDLPDPNEGTLCTGGKGNADIGCDTLPPPPKGTKAYKIETTIWREIK